MSNYDAIVAKVDRVVPIENRDRIQVGYVLGEQVIISTEVKVGDIGVLFVAGTQLSVDFCKNNNLFRDSTLNVDTTKAGYFENSRRVRAQPFNKVKSEGLFVGLDSLSYTGFDVTQLTLGTTFEDLNGQNVCKKYINERASKVSSTKQNAPKKKKMQTPLFKEHMETSQFKHNTHRVQPGDLISIQHKIHGTSVRYTHTKVFRELPWYKKLINKVTPIFPEFNWEYVVGTRRVVLQNENHLGFHGPEGYRYEWLEKLKPHLSRGMTVYGEIAGFANEKPIMCTHNTASLKDKKVSAKFGETVTYKYGCLPGTSRFHIYRITLTTDDGACIDFTQPQLVDWCNNHGFIPSTDLVKPFIFDGDLEALKTLVDQLTERPEVGTEDYLDPSHPSEGIIIRIDNGSTTPVFLKNKSYLFKCLEGICEEVDVEDIS